MSNITIPDLPPVTKMAFEVKYSDDSGIEFSVGLDGDAYEEEIKLKHVEEITFPLNRLEWLRACLDRIAYEVERAEEYSNG